MGTKDDEEEEMIETSKLQLVLAASSPVISHHVSLSLLSPPDDLSHSRASVPFSWEEEPGKPKHHHLLRGAPPNHPNRLHLPPRLLLPNKSTKVPLALDHPHHLDALKRWFLWKKDRDDDDGVTGKCTFVLSSENGNDTKITRTTCRLHCFSDVATCYLWEVPWKNNKLKKWFLKADDRRS
ncbi:Uncharacterized protein HA466_0103680 [Hirschfeldia incana]|nr:Uncharacterized protein HA466_0103680 [Hirschfeldia incana]